MAKRKITKKQYNRAKQIVADYEAQFALSFARGSFKAWDLEYLSHSVSIPKVKDGAITEAEMIILQSNLDECGVPWFEVATDDMGYLVIGFGRRINYQQYEDQLLEALNNL